MVLFNWGWSRLVNKLSLIRSLNQFASETIISKWWGIGGVFWKFSAWGGQMAYLLEGVAWGGRGSLSI